MNLFLQNDRVIGVGLGKLLKPKFDRKGLNQEKNNNVYVRMWSVCSAEHIFQFLCRRVFCSISSIGGMACDSASFSEDGTSQGMSCIPPNALQMKLKSSISLGLNLALVLVALVAMLFKAGRVTFFFNNYLSL